ncbi:conserved exported hypothetical protein [Candidatus Roizmanbacteria bacterium]|nr:conserved exported hypothetical protein [Candidatus Roizmanbacteria bacterium]
MFKRNIFKILAIVFFLLSGASFYNSNKTPVKQIIVNKQAANKIISPTKILTDILGREDHAPTMVPTQPIQQIQPTNTPTPTQTPTPNTLPITTSITISLSVGGSTVGSFNIPQDSNQCDVLTQALSQGKIQSLNMRYNSDFGTNAVYQINGIGKENAVWWGFKVNGQSPSQGCSYIKVNNGDSVLWEYVGN